MTAASSCLSLCLPRNAPPSLLPSPPPLCPTTPSLYPAPCSIPGTAKYWNRRTGRTTAPGGNGREGSCASLKKSISMSLLLEFKAVCMSSMKRSCWLLLSKDLPLIPVNLSSASTCLAILSHLSPEKPGLQMQLHEEEKSFLDEGGHVMLQHDCGKSCQPSHKGSSPCAECLHFGRAQSKKAEASDSQFC